MDRKGENSRQTSPRMATTLDHSIDLSVVIPAYNEALRLTRTLDATAAFFEARPERYEIIVVDDGSTDGTRKIAEAWAARQSLQQGLLRVLDYGSNRGKGHAVRHGILRAAAERYVLYMDADLATPIEEIDVLLAALDAGEANGIQVAIGSRPLAASQLLVRQPWYREMAGRAFNGAVQLAATPGIHDTQCGFKLMTARAARSIFSRATLDGFSFDVEALLLARKLGLGIAEVPVRWAHQEGAAAFSTPGAYMRQGIRMVGDLTRIRWAHRSVRPIVTSHVAGTGIATTASARPNP
jgi:dolichyl-phosphate beta-glucosyltransferase